MCLGVLVWCHVCWCQVLFSLGKSPKGNVHSAFSLDRVLFLFHFSGGKMKGLFLYLFAYLFFRCEV